MAKTRLVFSGSGGQGVITAGIIIAETAVLHEGLNAVQSQSYGAEARGGATRSDIIISDAPIYFPKIIQPNVLVCLTQMAYSKYVPSLRPGGLLITDSRWVRIEKTVDARRFELPLTRAVTEQIGQSVVLNICMLGAVVRLTEVVSPEAVKEVVKDRVPKAYLELNETAFDVGFDLAKKD
ncbi:MAG: 2-oxoacid:acceptor oxidoreductase family protein [Desulfobacterales bacterium]|nr:2-oxoacid:acceptor oxidoreductase family protein [Desulfobacterales bacterium]